MVTYSRFLLYTVLSIGFGQVKLQDVHLTCPESELFNGTQINLTCTVSTNYSSKCEDPVELVEFRVSSDEIAYPTACSTSVDKCDFNPNSEGCGCVNRNNTHYTLKYTFIGAVSHNITWDCFINCLDDRLNYALTFEGKFCRRRNVESIPELTTEIFKSPGNGDQSLDTGLIIGIAVGVTLAVVTTCIIVVLMFNKKICSKLKGSDNETPVQKLSNENQEKETDKLLSPPVQKESEPKGKLEKKENDCLSKPVQEETKSNVKQEKETDKPLSTPVEKESEPKGKLEKKENDGLSKPVQEQTETNEKQEKKDDSKPISQRNTQTV